MKNTNRESFERASADLFPLLAALRAGSGEADEEFVQHLRHYFTLVVQHEIGTRLQAKIGESDVVQQSCVKVLAKVQQFRGTTEAELRGWLKQLLRNEIKQVRRNFNLQKRDLRREVAFDGDSSHVAGAPPPADPARTPRAEAMAAERENAVRFALARLPQEYQRVIKLRSWQQLTFPQIAEQMGKSVNAAEKLWYRAIQKLRHELGDDDGQSR